MVDQRTLFKDFYGRIRQLDPVQGKVVGKQIFDLLCYQTIALRTYKEVQHPQLGVSAYFDIYLYVFKKKQYLIPGVLIVSMQYCGNIRPIMTLKINEKMKDLNTTIIGPNNIVNTDMFNHWNKNYSLVDILRDVVDKIQENPYTYEDIDDNDAATETVDEPKAPTTSAHFCENIPYETLHKGKLLGKGAYASVYEVDYNGMSCAMKEWTRPVSDYERTALNREISIQKTLDHPNCVHLYGVSRTPSNKPVLILERADSCLTSYTTRHDCRRLTNKEKCQIILEIAKGLEYIHSFGWIHRDIKLDNILMKNGHPLIADFGLSRAIDKGSGMVVTFAGSPAFMAPELITGSKVTTTIDVYSFGCIVNEIISEKVCYDGFSFRNQEDFYRKVRTGLRPTIFPETPDEVRLLLIDCYKNKNCRPTMNTIVQRIEMWDPDKW